MTTNTSQSRERNDDNDDDQSAKNASLVQEISDIQLKYESLEQTHNLLEMQNKEYLQEIYKLRSEKQEIYDKHQSLSEQQDHSDSATTSMVNIFRTNSKTLDHQHSTIESLQKRAGTQSVLLKRIESENFILTQQNQQYLQRLEQVNNELRDQTESVGAERRKHVAQIDALQQQLLDQSQQAQPVADDVKCSEVLMSPPPPLDSPVHDPKTMRFRTSLVGHQSRMSWLSSQSSDESNLNGLHALASFSTNKSYTSQHNASAKMFSAPTPVVMPDLAPLMDSPRGTQTRSHSQSRSYSPLYYADKKLSDARGKSDGADSNLSMATSTDDIAAVQVRDIYEAKMREVMDRHKMESLAISTRYNKLERQLQTLQTECDEQRQDLQRSTQQIHGLKQQNRNLKQQIESTTCNLFQLFS